MLLASRSRFVLGVGLARLVAFDRIDDAVRRQVPHRFRERAIEQEELRVVVMTRQNPVVHAVEPAVAQDELHVLVLAAVVPDGRVRPRVHFVQRAVGHVTPAARTDEIHRPANVEPRLIRSAPVAPQRERVRAVAQHVAIHDHRPVALAVNGERVRTDDAVRVLDREILDDAIVAVDVDHRAAEVVRLLGELIRSLREFDARALPALAAQASRNSGSIRTFSVIDAVLDEDDHPLRGCRAGWNRAPPGSS